MIEVLLVKALLLKCNGIDRINHLGLLCKKLHIREEKGRLERTFSHRSILFNLVSLKIARGTAHRTEKI